MGVCIRNDATRLTIMDCILQYISFPADIGNLKAFRYSCPDVSVSEDRFGFCTESGADVGEGFVDDEGTAGLICLQFLFSELFLFDGDHGLGDPVVVPSFSQLGDGDPSEGFGGVRTVEGEFLAEEQEAVHGDLDPESSDGCAFGLVHTEVFGDVVEEIDEILSGFGDDVGAEHEIEL